MLWIKAFHVIAMVCWFAGIFYLPRLFVYHALSDDIVSRERFKIMERKLLYGIMTPAALLTIGLGAYLVSFSPAYYAHALWFQLKMIAVALLLIYHIYCGILYHQFNRDSNPHSHVYYRIINEIPVILLVVIVLLVCVKP